MGQSTAQMIGRVRGPASDDGSRRRRLAKDVRNVRERLTSSIGLERAFDHELIRLFAEYRTSASVPLFGLAAAISAVATVWIPLQNALLWLILVTAAMALMLTLSQRFLREDPDSVALETWRRRFILGETLQGASWALIVQVLIPVEAAGARSFLLFVLVMLAALIAMLSATIPAAVYAGLVPVALAILTLTLSAPDRDTIMLMAMAGSAQFFFIFLANRLYCSAVATLQSRAEKDAIFAELEQAKANSDEARRRAEEANLAKSRFLATMSHELRTPLNAVIGFSEAITVDPDPERGKDYVRCIHEAGRHLLSLIDDILDVTRGETTGFQTVEAEVAVIPVVEGVVRVMQATAATAGVTVQATLPPALPVVRADELRLRQVLLNLVSNAVKFTPQGGHVSVSAEQEGGGDLVLRVADSGIGIKAEDIPRAFEPFTQLDSS
ncbi:MAG: sensor histidine kinase, partial [Microvirga sp.]